MNIGGRPAFTIAIPVRNGETYLAQAIESAMRQTRAADEILVVDDASTDRTREIAQDPRWAGRVRYVFNEPATGFADAFNRLARFARSDYVVPLSTDDLLDDECVASLETGFRAFPSAGLCFVGFTVVDAAGKPTGGESPRPHSRKPRFFRGPDYVHHYLSGIRDDAHVHRCGGFAVKRSLMLATAFRREAGLIADDDFFTRVGSAADVVGIAAPLFRVRMHASSITSRLDSLGYRLAEDYMFQLRDLAGGSRALAPANLRIYEGLTARVLHGLFVESICRGRRDLLERAVALQREFSTFVGDGGRADVAAWKQPTWRLAAGGGLPTWLLRRLVDCLHAVRLVKRSLTGGGRGQANLKGESSSV